MVGDYEEPDDDNDLSSDGSLPGCECSGCQRLRQQARAPRNEPAPLRFREPDQTVLRRRLAEIRQRFPVYTTSSLNIFDAGIDTAITNPCFIPAAEPMPSPATPRRRKPRPSSAPARTGNQRRSLYNLTSTELELLKRREPQPSFEFVDTAFGRVLLKNAVTLNYPEYECVRVHKRRAVELDPYFYDDHHYVASTDENLVRDYAGRAIHKQHAARIEFGAFAGQYYAWRTPYRRDRDIVGDYNGRTAHRDTPTVPLAGGRFLFEGDPAAATLVEVYAVENNEAVLGRDLPHRAVMAIVDEDGTVALTSTSHVARVGDEEEYYLNAPALLDACGIGYSDNLSRYDFRDHARFYSTTKKNAGYHGLDRRDYSRGAAYTVGFEVEKEDGDAVKIPYGPLYGVTGWCKERDGSLDDYSGYELVSPVFDLMSDALDQAIAGSTELQQLVNARFSRACGGHINFGVRGWDGATTLDAVAGYLPLIYAMFPGRAKGIHSRFAAARKKDELRDESDHTHYVSVKVHPNRIEFRVFGAVRDVRNLLWRRDLMRHLANHLHFDAEVVLAQALDGESALHRLLTRVYSPSRLLALVGRAVEIHQHIEDEQLDVTLQLRNLAPAPAGTEYLLA